MSIKLMSMIFEVKAQLSPTEKLILLELADHANDQGGGIWPGWDTIMERTSLSRSAVRDTLAYLTEIGLLKTISKPTGNSSTRREINVRLLQELVACGKEGIRHPTIAQTRNAANDREAQKKLNKRGIVPPADTPVSPEDTPKPDSLGRQPTPSMSPGDPPVSQHTTPRSPSDTESFINHSLNLQGNRNDPLSDRQAWEMIADQLRAEMKRVDYETWIQPLKPIRYQNQVFHIGAINSYGRDWVASRLTSRITHLLESIYGQPVTIQIELVN